MGPNYWMVDFNMNCDETVNGWFEFKAYVTGWAERTTSLLRLVLELWEVLLLIPLQTTLLFVVNWIYSTTTVGPVLWMNCKLKVNTKVILYLFSSFLVCTKHQYYLTKYQYYSRKLSAGSKLKPGILRILRPTKIQCITVHHIIKILKLSL